MLFPVTEKFVDFLFPISQNYCALLEYTIPSKVAYKVVKLVVDMDVDKVVDEVTDMVVAIKVEKVVGMVFLFLYSDYFYDWKFQHSPSGFTIYKM